MQPSVQPRVVRYGYAVAAVVIALGAAWVLHAFDLEGFLFVIAVAVAVWFGGRGPGVLAIILSILVLHYFFIAPLDTGSQLPNFAYFVLFAVLAVLITVLSERRRRAEQTIVQARDALEATVQERTAELRTQAELLNLAHDAVLVRESDGRITFWNRGAEETYGWSAAEAIGSISHTLLQTTFPIPRNEIESITRERGRWDGELVHVRRDGATIVVASRWSQQRDKGGVPIAVLEINRDITDRKQAEEALRSAETALAHVARVTTLGEVTASLAHELNQPLAAIVNNANASLGLLPVAHDLDEVRSALADIVSDAERASAVIQRVRALTKRSPLEREPVTLAAVVDDVVALAAGESAARRVIIRVDVPADLPIVLGDRVQLQQVLLNLLLNAMDAMNHMDTENRVLQIRGRQDVRNGTRVATISVEDRGVGLTGVALDRLFEAFYTTKSHGMGMGLAISRSIIEAHGGRLWAEPNHGAPGATFSFSLPAAPANQ